MTEPTRPQSPLERTLTWLMLAGVWISAASLAAGLGLLLIEQQASDGDGLMRAGLLVLMSTPVVRVVLSVAEAVRQRDWFWLCTITAVVLILAGTLAYSWALL